MGSATTYNTRYGAEDAAREMTNTAQLDPRLDTHATQVQGRIDNPSQSTGRAIDLAVGRLRDLGEGQKRAGSSSFARRGMLGSGGQADFESGIDEDIRREGSGAAADIALQRERDDDAFLLGSTGALAAPGEAARADRSLSQQQWEMETSAQQRAYESQEANRQAQEAQAFAQQQAILALLQSGEATATAPPPSSGFGASSRTGH